ncbi:MAG: KilA-N domain-containing protein [Sulfuricurvum sp.]
MPNITVLDHTVTVNKEDYISLTDIAKYKDGSEANDIIRNWLRNRNTIEFLGIWEQLYNSDFKPVEFDGFRKEAGLNSFTLSPAKWVETTNAIGIISKSGRYGGRCLNEWWSYEMSDNLMF